MRFRSIADDDRRLERIQREVWIGVILSDGHGLRPEWHPLRFRRIARESLVPIEDHAVLSRRRKLFQRHATSVATFAARLSDWQTPIILRRFPILTLKHIGYPGSLTAYRIPLLRLTCRTRMPRNVFLKRGKQGIVMCPLALTARTPMVMNHPLFPFRHWQSKSSPFPARLRSPLLLCGAAVCLTWRASCILQKIYRCLIAR